MRLWMEKEKADAHALYAEFGEEVVLKVDKIRKDLIHPNLERFPTYLAALEANGLSHDPRAIRYSAHKGYLKPEEVRTLTEFIASVRHQPRIP